MTGAMDQKVFRNNVLFRWEASPGLDHHCGTCSTPLHNARAKSSCIGHHVEPCYRFHQQLHFVGKSHDCKSCTHAHEMHYARHKSILTTVRKLSDFDDELANHLVKQIALQEPHYKSPQGSQSGPAARPSDDLKTDDGLPTMRWSERKTAKKIGIIDTPNKRQEVESFSQKDTNFISDAIHCALHEGKGAWGGQNTCIAFSRNEEPTGIDVGAEAKSLAKAIDALDPDSDTPNSKQKRNAKKITAVEKARHVHGNTRGNSPKKTTLKVDLLEGLDPQIFYRLGIQDIDPPKSTAIRKDLIRKLITQVKEDLAIQTHEESEAKMREDAFWSWAGKGAYHLIMRNRENIDWATGVKRSINNEITSRQGLQPQVSDEINEAENVTSPDDMFLDDTPIEDITATETQPDLTPLESETKLRDNDATGNNDETRKSKVRIHSGRNSI